MGSDPAFSVFGICPTDERFVLSVGIFCSIPRGRQDGNFLLPGAKSAGCLYKWRNLATRASVSAACRRVAAAAGQKQPCASQCIKP